METYVLYAHVGCLLEGFQVLEALCLHEVQVLFAVQVLFVWARFKVKIVVRTVIVIVVILRQLVRYLDTQADRGLVSPAAGHILDGVPSATQNQKRQIPTLDELNTLCVALDRTIMRAQFVISKRVGTTLDHNRIWSEPHPHLFHYLNNSLSDVYLLSRRSL